MLEYKYATKEEIPESYAELYTEKDGEYILTGVNGLKTPEDVSKVQEAARKARAERDEAANKLKTYAALGEAEELQTKLDRIAELELAAEGKIDEEKMNQLVDTRVKAKVAPIERENNTLKEAKAEAEAQVAAFQAQAQARTIQDSLRSAASEAKVVAAAVDDVLMYQGLFTIDELGKVVTKDNSGVTPGIEASVWLTEVKPQKNHWFPGSEGAGATGSGGATNTGNNPWTHEHWDMTEQGKIYVEDRTKAEQLAKSAGTTIGGARPVPKKPAA